MTSTMALDKAGLEHQLQTSGVQLVTKLRSNPKNRLPMTWNDRILLRRRAIVESLIDQLKNHSQIEHSRHRSEGNFLVNLRCGLIAYDRQSKKPSLGRETLAVGWQLRTRSHRLEYRRFPSRICLRIVSCSTTR